MMVQFQSSCRTRNCAADVRGNGCSSVKQSDLLLKAAKSFVAVLVWMLIVNVPCVWNVAVNAAPPNIIFILADDLGYTDLGCYGSEYYETPNIDRLAAQGLRFLNHHHCQNCTPTRAAILSGQHPARTGIYTVGKIDRFDWSKRPLEPVENNTVLPLDLATIADQLKKVPYATGMFGKWHIGSKGLYHPRYRGFDEAIETMGMHFDFETDPIVDYPKGEYLADFLTQRAIGFIERHKDKPFFLYLPHFGVHSPHEAKMEWIQHFRTKRPVAGHRNPTYAAMIASVDESVGRILDKLDETNLAENTIVLFASDNGGLGGYAKEGIKSNLDITDNFPLRSGKGSLYEGGTRVPLIARWPNKIPADSTCHHPTIHVDLFPTMLELANAPIPNQPLDGRSLLPMLYQPTACFDRQAIFQHFPGYIAGGFNAWRTTPVSTIQSGHWKLLEFLEDGHLELYNLDRDIGESVDLAATEPAQAQALHRQLCEWREHIQAPMPRKNLENRKNTKRIRSSRPR